jgi:hypothetical protein
VTYGAIALPSPVDPEAAEPLLIRLETLAPPALLLVGWEQDNASLPAACQSKQLLPHIFLHSPAAAMQHDRPRLVRMCRLGKAERVISGAGRRSAAQPRGYDQQNDPEPQSNEGRIHERFPIKRSELPSTPTFSSTVPSLFGKIRKSRRGQTEAQRQVPGSRRATGRGQPSCVPAGLQEQCGLGCSVSSRRHGAEPAARLPRSGSTPKPRVAERTLGAQKPKIAAPCKGATCGEETADIIDQGRNCTLAGCREWGVPCPRVRCAPWGFGVERLRR